MQDNDNNQPYRSGAETLAAMQEIARDRTLQAQHAIGDPVTIAATVVGINFSNSKVRYVVQIGDNAAIVDSCDVAPMLKVAS